jgi:hydrogenase-4 membrane subunit HyfE
MRRSVLFAALSLVLVGAAALIVYLVGLPLLHGALISCAPAGSREHAFGCSTAFGAFTALVLFVLALGIAHLSRRFW